MSPTCCRRSNGDAHGTRCVVGAGRNAKPRASGRLRPLQLNPAAPNRFAGSVRSTPGTGIKLDENLPEFLWGSLGALGHPIDTVRGEGLVGRPEEDVWRAAQADRRSSSPKISISPTCGSSSPGRITGFCSSACGCRIASHWERGLSGTNPTTAPRTAQSLPPVRTDTHLDRGQTSAGAAGKLNANLMSQLSLSSLGVEVLHFLCSFL
jgi:hypothetical protein